MSGRPAGDDPGYRPGEAADRQGPLDLGPRLDRLFEAGCDWLTAQGEPDHVAVHAADGTLTYHELDCLANQLARHLLDRAVIPGDRIGLLLDQGADTYIAMLAALKIQAVYVVLDLSFSTERIEHLITEGGVRTIVSEAALAERLPVPENGPEIRVVLVDAEALDIGRRAPTRLDGTDHPESAGEVASLVYPLKAAGASRGAEISHAGMANFALTTAKLCGLTMQDRVYEGLSDTLSFSVEGIWVAWMVGATLVPKPAGPSLRGPELRRFLATNRVTALYCTPTLLAGIDEDLPLIRFVLLSGQACPSDLLARWRRPGRRVISVYGTIDSDRTVTRNPVRPDLHSSLAAAPEATVHLAPQAHDEAVDSSLSGLLH